MKKILCSLLLFSGLAAQAQSHKLEWVRSLYANSDIHPMSITVDMPGFVYVTGYFKGTADFMPGPGSYNKTSFGNKDIFLAKFDPGGMMLWTITMGSSGDDWGTAIQVSDAGHVLVNGVFNGVIDLDPTTITYPIGAAYVDDLFTAKYTNDGMFMWGNRIGSMDPDLYGAIKTDPPGNVYQGGTYRRIMDVNPSPVTLNINPVGGSDVFYTKWNEMGLFSWAKTFGSTNDDTLRATLINRLGHSFLAGTYAKEMDINPGATVTKVPFSGGQDIFVSQLDENGSYVRSVTLGGAGADIVRSIAMDVNDNMYIAGDFEGDVDFNPTDTAEHIVNAKGVRDAFLLCLDSAFKFKWVQTFGAAGQTTLGMGTGTDPGYHPYLAGMFTGTQDMDPGDSVQSFTSAGGFDIFTSRFDSSGNLIWAKAYGGKQNDTLNSFYVHQSAAVYGTGIYRDTVDFDPGLRTSMENGSTTLSNLFMNKLAVCIPSYDTIKTSTCDSFVFAGVKYTHTGIYNQVIPSETNCDSIVHLNLFISPALDSHVSLSGVTFTAAETKCTYQWINCLDKKILPGATGRSYIAIGDGDYAVIIDNGICRDTTACMTVTGVPKYNAIREEALSASVSVYPNPSNGIFTIETGEELKGTQVTIVNTLGQAVKQFILDKNSLQQQLPAGFYLLEFRKNDLRFTKKLMVQ